MGLQIRANFPFRNFSGLAIALHMERLVPPMFPQVPLTFSRPKPWSDPHCLTPTLAFMSGAPNTKIYEFDCTKPRTSRDPIYSMPSECQRLSPQ